MRQNTNEPHSGRNCGFGELFCQGAQRHLRQRPAGERHGGIESRIRRYAPCVPRPCRTRALIAVHREHRDQHHFRNRDVPSRQCVVLGVACHFRSLVVGRPGAVGSTLRLLELNSIHKPSRTALIGFPVGGTHEGACSRCCVGVSAYGRRLHARATADRRSDSRHRVRPP